MSNIPFEIFISLYDYVPFIYPVNKETYSYITKKRNNKAAIIQRWYKKYKIEEKMPMLFSQKCLVFQNGTLLDYT